MDFRVSVEDIQEEIQYYSVSYEWKVYNEDGTYGELPAGVPSEPATTGGHTAGEDYQYDTEYVNGTSFYDYDAGLLYSFSGWTTYSHSSTFNPVPTTGYYTLEDIDTIEITADTYIYGYWEASELTPASAHIEIDKVFIVDGVETTMEDTEDLCFCINTGIDKDNDDDTTIDADYPMIAAIKEIGSEYKIPVYQYDTPFVFTEYNADVPGYTHTTTVTVTGDYITDYTQNGDSVSVTMDPVYQGENIHLGTVTYTNTYTKKTGEAVHVYPALTILKSAYDTHLAQNGVEFTLYSDAACITPVTKVITANGDIAQLDFASVEGGTAGTYYLKETTPLAGYYADSYIYPVSLTESSTVEELRNGEYVQATYYTVSVTVPTGSKAVYSETTNYTRLHIYNEPILGSLNLTKTTVGLDDAAKNYLDAIVIVHGPIVRDVDNILVPHGSWN